MAIAVEPALGGSAGSVNLALGVTIERVANDTVFPFTRPDPGDAVIFRVTVRNAGGPASARRDEIGLEITARGGQIAGLRGFGRCRRTGPGVLFCTNTIRLDKGDGGRVLVRVPATSGVVALLAEVGKAPGAQRELSVTKRFFRRTIRVDPPPWTGSWSWTATRRETGTVIVAPGSMDIGQAGVTVCSIWSFFGGGISKGTVALGRWVARWRDSFSTGDWTLTLVSDNQFRGVQHTRRFTGAPVETYDVVGRRLSTGGAPRCSDITVP